jgi:hypothetical protein
MQTTALIAALFFGAIGFVSLLGISLYATQRIDGDFRKTHSREDRHLLNSLYALCGLAVLGALVLGGFGNAGIAVLAVLIGVVAAAFLVIDLGRAVLWVISPSRRRRP